MYDSPHTPRFDRERVMKEIYKHYLRRQQIYEENLQMISQTRRQIDESLILIRQISKMLLPDDAISVLAEISSDREH